MDELIQLIAIITMFQLGVFVVYLLAGEQRKRLINIRLAVFLTCNFLYLAGFLLSYFVLSLPEFFYIAYVVLMSSGWFFGPTLLFYTETVLNGDTNSEKLNNLHFLPWLVILSVKLVFIINSITAGVPHNGSLPKIVQTIIQVAFFIQILVYLIFILARIYTSREEAKNYISSFQRTAYSFLLLVVFGFFAMWVIDLINFILHIASGEYYTFLILLSVLINLIFANILIIRGLKEYHLILTTEKQNNKPRYQKSVLSSEDVHNSGERLKKILQEEKIYLDPDLSINRLAEKVGLPVKELSRVINEYFGVNFYDLINRYRIDEARRIMESSDGMNKTILEILYEAGFNSKSVFNNSFKKYTGITPTQFRRSISVNNLAG